MFSGVGGSVASTTFGVGGQNAQGGGSTTGGAASAGVGTSGPCVDTMCTSGGWCWLNPLPQGNSLFDAAVHDGELWAFGDDGLVLRGDGEHWLRCPTPTTESLRGSWFDPDGILWVVGTGGVVLSFDGKTWTQHYAEAGLFLNDIHGSSTENIWAVGNDVVLHWSGQTWTRETLETKGSLYSIWARDTDDVWVGGTEVWHYNGATWQAVYNKAKPARGIWVDESGAVWMAANDVLQCDLLDCQLTPTLVGEQIDVWGTSSTDVWTIGTEGGMHWDGSRWTTFDVPTNMTSAAGGDPYGLVVVGYFGRIFRREGSDWVNLRGAIGSIWTHVWGVSDDDIWIAGNSMAHFDGLALAVTSTPTEWGLLTAHGTASDDVWAAGCNGTIIHWNGREWADYSLRPWPQWDLCFRAIWAESRSSAWVTGTQGLAYHWDGYTWTAVSALSSLATSRALFGVAGALFAADDSGSLSQWTSLNWQTLAMFTSEQSNSIWGASTTDLWVVGTGTTGALATHVQNGSVSQEELGSTTLTAAWGTSGNDVWATGDGRIFHYDGQSFVEQPSGVHIDSSSIWVAPSGARWIVGGNGILRHAP